MVENPNRKVEKLLPEERLGGNGLFARVTVFPGREIDYHEHHGETETYHIIAGEGVCSTNSIYLFAVSFAVLSHSTHR